MDIELAVTAMEMAPHVDQMVLFSGDGDFRSLVESLQRQGVRVSVVSTVVTQPPMVADELRRQADEFIDLAQLAPRIGRDPASARRAPANRVARPPTRPRARARAAGRDRARVSEQSSFRSWPTDRRGSARLPFDVSPPAIAASAIGSPLFATLIAPRFLRSATRRSNRSVIRRRGC